ncbi:MAG: flagellar basal body-associated FliL family protein [Desulfarculus sp.]|nr:flagellar basal body-associated FliL family protein [Desulfarculus sp.]
MSPEIPLAPVSQEPEGPTRKVLDQSQFAGEGFDEDVLAEIERRLDREDFSGAARPNDRVELDKADLPTLEAVKPPPTELEVDLSGEIPTPAARITPEPIPEIAVPEAPRRRTWLWIGLGGGVLLLLLSSLGTWMWLRSPAPAPASSAAQVPAAKPPSGKVVEKMPSTQALVIPLEPFLVPLMKTGKDEGRLLRLTVTAELGDDAGKRVLAEKRILLRDTIYRLLRERPAGEVEQARNKQMLAGQIRDAVNAALGQPVVQQIAITEFIITG